MILLLSIVIPLGFLTSFKLAGLINQAQTIAETITQPPVVWAFERVPANLELFEWNNASYTTGEIDARQSLFIGNFFAQGPFNDLSSFYLRFVLNATVPNGYVVNATIAIDENYTGPVDVDVGPVLGSDPFPDEFNYLELSSLSLAKWGTNSSGTRALLEMSGTPSSSTVYCCWTYLWGLVTPFNETHETLLVSETTFFNGTVYKKLVQPFQIRFYHDHDDSFEQAEEIGLGTRRDYVCGEGIILEGDDPCDFFKIWLEAGQAVTVALGKPEGGKNSWWGIQMYVYGPDRQLENFVQDENSTTPLTLKPTEAGWWYIEVTGHGGQHVYLLTITAKQD